MLFPRRAFLGSLISLVMVPFTRVLGRSKKTADRTHELKRGRRTRMTDGYGEIRLSKQFQDGLIPAPGYGDGVFPLGASNDRPAFGHPVGTLRVANFDSSRSGHHFELNVRLVVNEAGWDESSCPRKSFATFETEDWKIVRPVGLPA